MPIDYVEARQFLRERIEYYSGIEQVRKVRLIAAQQLKKVTQIERRQYLEPVMEKYGCSEAVALQALMDLFDRYPDM